MKKTLVQRLNDEIAKNATRLDIATGKECEPRVMREQDAADAGAESELFSDGEVVSMREYAKRLARR